MDDKSFCTGHISCTSFGIILVLLLMVIFFNYIAKCLCFHSSTPPNLLLTTTITATTTATNDTDGIVTDRPPLSVHSPLYRLAISSIPEAAYDTSKNTADTNNHNNSKSSSFESDNCAICLAEYEEGEAVRVLPRCKHVYHVECIDQWLRRSLRCPICRERVIDQQIHAKLLSNYHQQQLGLPTNNNNANNPTSSLVINIGNGHASVLI